MKATMKKSKSFKFGVSLKRGQEVQIKTIDGKFFAQTETDKVSLLPVKAFFIPHPVEATHHKHR